MDIEYHGENCVTLKGKGYYLIVDPIESLSVKGLKDPESIVVLTKPNDRASKGSSFVIDMPGEYEHNDVSIKGIPMHFYTDESGKNSTMYRIELSGIRVAIIGHVDAPLADEDLESLGVIDIVVVPVGGGGYTLDAKDAATIVRQISPKLVMPTHFSDSHIKYEVPQESVEEFIKAMGGSSDKSSSLKVKGLASLPESLTVVELDRVS